MENNRHKRAALKGTTAFRQLNMRGLDAVLQRATLVMGAAGAFLAASPRAALTVLGRLQWQLQQLPVVNSTQSVVSFLENTSMLVSEGSPKWFGIEPNQQMLGGMSFNLPPNLTDFKCSFAPLYISLVDHQAKTLTTIANTVQAFINQPENQSPHFKISLAGGNAGIQAATNLVVQQANRNMLFLVYSVVIIFCFITFRSWRAVLCAVLPLTVTSILAQALMVWLGIGVKVATLPVVALGVESGWITRSTF